MEDKLHKANSIKAEIQYCQTRVFALESLFDRRSFKDTYTINILGFRVEMEKELVLDILKKESFNYLNKIDELKKQLEEVQNGD